MIGLLFGLGIRLGLAVAPVIADYANADASAPWQAVGPSWGLLTVDGATRSPSSVTPHA